MNREERAKQFMPFAALKGYQEALKNKEKIRMPRPELSEDYAEELDRKLRSMQKNDMITVVYYQNGEYLKLTGMVTKVDKTQRILKIVNTRIPFDRLYQIWYTD